MRKTFILDSEMLQIAALEAEREKARRRVKRERDLRDAILRTLRKNRRLA